MKSVGAAMTFIEQILATSRRIHDDRTDYAVLAKATEELGELAQEVMIENGDHYKEPGKDGIVGEAIDTIICCVDLIYQQNKVITEATLQRILSKKLAKWAEKAELQRPGCVDDEV